MSTENIVTLNQNQVEAARQRKENQAIVQLALIVSSFMLGYLPQSGKTDKIREIYFPVILI